MHLVVTSLAIVGSLIVSLFMFGRIQRFRVAHVFFEKAFKLDGNSPLRYVYSKIGFAIWQAKEDKLNDAQVEWVSNRMLREEIAKRLVEQSLVSGSSHWKLIMSLIGDAIVKGNESSLASPAFIKILDDLPKV